MNVRPARAADAAAVVELEAELFGADAWSLPSVLEELTGPHRHSVVATRDATVLGYACTLRTDDTVDLQRIAVGVDHQRQGVARALLAAVVDRAREDGGHRMLLEVGAHNVAGLAFYADAGFVEIDRRRRYYRDGSDAVVMRRTLEDVSNLEGNDR